MDEELLGYVASSGWRKRVLRSLDSHGPMEPGRVASLEHLPERVVESVLQDAKGREIVEDEAGEFRLTEGGKRLVSRLAELEG